MHDTVNFRLSVQNKILSVLPDSEMDFLAPHFERVNLSPRNMIYQAGDSIPHIYFPNNGMISLLSVTEQGQTVEVGFTGFEGLVGIPVLLGQNEMPYQALAQSPLECLRLDALTAVKLFKQYGVFHDVVLRYVTVILKQLSQTCICNNLHRIEERLCRWLTVMCERSGSNHLLLTQEFIAHMLGVQRTSIGLIANSLQEKEIIKYRRGKIEVVNFENLKNSACECYAIIKDEQQKFVEEESFAVMSDN
ncbi:MAG: Crp/Fnr family transcriptional regulator [Pyrinomonadaceae bacterium]